MRKLLIKLVALETALVGWLAYWLFLVYSNNPSVAGGLVSQLSRFPQLSFTTVDLTVLVIIGVLSIFLAFKFQRGLKPGIRLERALQMLENLMKRNLILEAQVAEMKLEKTQIATPAPGVSSGEARPGSWEKAFRTPIEAGPAPSSQSVHLAGPMSTEKGSDYEPPMPRSPPHGIEPKPTLEAGIPLKPPLAASDRLPGKATSALVKPVDKLPTSELEWGVSSTWEDNPKFLGETSGVLIPSPPPRKQNTPTSDTVSKRQPYIPAPVPKVIPSSIILGPGVSSVPQARPLGKPGPSTKFVASPQSGQKPGPPVPTPQPTASEPLPPPAFQDSQATEMTRPSPPEKLQGGAAVRVSSKDSENPAKTAGKPSSTKKRFPWEDD